MRLTEERKRRGWSQAKLARESDLNATTVCLIENRRWRPYRKQLVKLARALGVDEAHAYLLLENGHPAGSGEGQSS